MAKSALVNTPPEATMVGNGPILAALARRIGPVTIIDQLLTWDATRCRFSPGEQIVALILNVVTEREPLYQVDDTFRLTDPALLLGAGITGDDLADDALGRALDKFAQAGPAEVFSAVRRGRTRSRPSTAAACTGIRRRRRCMVGIPRRTGPTG